MDAVELRSKRRRWRAGQIVLALICVISLVALGDLGSAYLASTPPLAEMAMYLLPWTALLVLMLYGLDRMQRHLERNLPPPAHNT